MTAAKKDEATANDKVANINSELTKARHALLAAERNLDAKNNDVDNNNKELNNLDKEIELATKTAKVLTDTVSHDQNVVRANKAKKVRAQQVVDADKAALKASQDKLAALTSALNNVKNSKEVRHANDVEAAYAKAANAVKVMTHTVAHDQNVLIVAQKNAVHTANVAKIAQKTLNDDAAKLADLNLAIHNVTNTTVDTKTVDNHSVDTNANSDSNKVSLGKDTVAVLPTTNTDQAVKAVKANVADESATKNAQNNAAKNALPQTGNENSAAVMALGAVSAMLGLGMVAKKREF